MTRLQQPLHEIISITRSILTKQAHIRKLTICRAPVYVCFRRSASIHWRCTHQQSALLVQNGCAARNESFHSGRVTVRAKQHDPLHSASLFVGRVQTHAHYAAIQCEIRQTGSCLSSLESLSSSCCCGLQWSYVSICLKSTKRMHCEMIMTMHGPWRNIIVIIAWRVICIKFVVTTAK